MSARRSAVRVEAARRRPSAKHTILFEQVTECVSLLAVQPPSEESEQHSERGGIDHGRSLYHGPQIVRRRPSIQLWDITLSLDTHTVLGWDAEVLIMLIGDKVRYTLPERTD